jgi:hypothetical protein
MAKCPQCNSNILWWKYLFLMPGINPKLWISCNHCKTEVKPKNWFFWLMFLIFSIFSIGGIFYWIANVTEFSSTALFVLWIAYVIVAQFVLMLAEYEKQ